MTDSADLSDFILPAIIEKASDFSPKAARERFERASRALAWQAFWLSVFEYLERFSDCVEGVSFAKGYSDAEGSMAPVPLPGADPARFEKARGASASAFSKARGKLLTGSKRRPSHLSAAGHLGADAVARLADRETILLKALGPELGMLRKASLEAGALREALAGQAFEALAGRPRRRGL